MKGIIDFLDKALVKDCPKYLDGINWDICVLDHLHEGAAARTGEKNLISLKWMENMETDAEVAVVIGHEVAHVVAGHHYDFFTRELSLSWTIYLILCSVVSRIIPNPYMLNKLRDLPLSKQRMYELEADHIGAILMALAGYDPRTAIFHFEKDNGCGDYWRELLYNIEDESLLTHPSGKRRVLMLSQIMEEAISVYEQVTAKYHVQPRSTGDLSLIPKD